MRPRQVEVPVTARVDMLNIHGGSDLVSIQSVAALI